MDHGQLEEAVASYALGALDYAERREIEGALLDHLPGCDSCRRMLADFREVVGDLALVAGARAVSEEVEKRLMERIRGERPAALAAVPRRVGWWARVGVAAAMAAIAALGSWNLSLGSQVSDARARTAGLAQALTVIGAPDATSVLLTGRPPGRMLFVQRPGEAVLLARDVLSPGDDRVFQLWLMRDGVPTDAGVFVPAEGLGILALGHDATGFDAVAVTIERAPGARRPSGSPVYTASLA